MRALRRRSCLNAVPSNIPDCSPCTSHIEGVLYEFDTASRLLLDFYEEVDRLLKKVFP